MYITYDRKFIIHATNTIVDVFNLPKVRSAIHGSDFKFYSGNKCRDVQNPFIFYDSTERVNIVVIIENFKSTKRLLKKNHLPSSRTFSIETIYALRKFCIGVCVCMCILCLCMHV